MSRVRRILAVKVHDSYVADVARYPPAGVARDPDTGRVPAVELPDALHEALLECENIFV